MDNKRIQTMKSKIICVGYIFGIILLLYFLCYFLIISEKDVDVMAGMQLYFEGENGEGIVTATIENEIIDQRINEVLDSIHYEIEPNSNLSNGDQITVSAIVDDEDLLKRYHIKLLNKTKQFEVSGLAVPYTNASVIPASYLELIKEEAKNYITENKNLIIQNNFQQFHQNTEIELTSVESKYQVFLKAQGEDNDRILTIFEVKANGDVNTAQNGVSLQKQESVMYFAVTMQGINTSNKISKEDIYASKIVLADDVDILDGEAVTNYLQTTYPQFIYELIEN